MEEDSTERLEPMTQAEADALMDQELAKTAREKAFFDAHRDEWIAEHEGTFALVKGEAVHGFFPSFEEAYDSGATRFGTDAPMLIQRVARADELIEIPALLHGTLLGVD